MEIVDYLLARKKAGGGSDVTIEQLSVTENGTYSEEGIAYSPVVVNVPAPENSYQLTDIPTGTVSTIEDGTDLPMSSLKVGIEPVQDLHGYDHPWVGGAGKNLFDKSQTFIKDKYIDVNGDIQNTTYGWEISDYIPLKNNTNYYISGNNVTGASAYNALYDSDKNLVRTFGYLSGDHNGTFATDVNEFYIRICTQESVVNNVQLEEGSTATSYEPYSNICPISGWTAANVTRTGKNLTDDAIDGHYIDTDGTEKDLTSYRCTDYVNVNGITYLKVSISTTYPNFWVWRIASYDINKNFIELSLNRVIANGDFEEEVTLPSNAKYIRASAIINSTNWNIYDKTTFSTYTIQFTDGDNPLTVYGGTLDVTTGELVVDRYEGILAPVASNIVVPSAKQCIFPTPAVANGYTLVNTKLMCDKLTPSNYSITEDNHIMFSNASLFSIVLSNEVGTTKEAWAQWLTDMQISVCYELAKPITYHLTPTQVRTLVGNNNIWADTGDALSGKYFKEL